MTEPPAGRLDCASDPTGLAELLPALQRLDRLLERAVAAAPSVFGADAAADGYRGLYVSREEVERLLAREPGTALFGGSGPSAESGAPEAMLEDGSRLARLQRSFGLSPFEVDVLLLALAPELDLRYERLYAYLQDDVTKKRPTLELALNLLCPSATEKLGRRRHFAPGAPLLARRLVRLIPDPNQVEPPLLAHYVKLDPQVVALLLGEDGLDRRLALVAEVHEPAARLQDLPVGPGTKEALASLAAGATGLQRPLALYLHGPAGVGKRLAAEALAAEAGLPLLRVDLGRLRDTEDPLNLLAVAFREGRFRPALLHLDGVDALRDGAPPRALGALLEELGDHAGVTVLSGQAPWVPSSRRAAGVVELALPMPGFDERRACWRAALEAAGARLPEAEIEALAGRFRLTPAQIADAAATAANRALADPGAAGAGGAGPGGVITADGLFRATRAQSGHELGSLAQRIEPLHAWDDIVLPEDALAQLREIGQRVAHRRRVLGDWGFERKLSLGKGVTALFSGPSGTGKTMAAEIMAGELGLGLYRIDLSGVVSKYIGETEKNLDRVFRAAENANAILFFDEADALFGKRSEVRDSHDRYANVEISYLLQKMELYEGLAILATNLRQNLDEAFIRRLAFTVHFPSPDEASRRRIWEGIWPAETPVAADLDLDLLAHRFKLSGGNIRNVALAAAFLAAEEGDAVTLGHVLQAVRREYQKMGKVLSEAESAAPADET